MSNKKKLVKKVKKIWRQGGPKELTRRVGHVVAYQTHTRAYRALPAPIKKRMSAPDDEYIYLQNPIFQIDSADIVQSKKITETPLPTRVQTANWFVPYFTHLAFGGIYTIFRFISYLQEQGLQNRIIIYDNSGIDADSMKQDIAEAFPPLKDVELIVFEPKVNKLSQLPSCDIAFCTFWVSAYLLLKFNKTKRKYYFIQDYEPLFYRADGTYALAESTYRFGFRGIVNTPGLLAAINQRHGMEGISFVPAVDRTLYYPVQQKNSAAAGQDPVKIFFYARPNNPRNAFFLGVQIIKRLKKKYGKRIEIITAGSEWKERRYGLEGLITNMGLIKTLPEVAELYRQCDIGFVYMLTKHPSYQPFEFMASGMATVTNNNEDNWWLLKHEENCLLAEPSPKAMAEQIGRLIEEPTLRQKIVESGERSIQNEWETQLGAIWNDIRQH